MTSAGASKIGKFIAHDKLRSAQEEMAKDGIKALNQQGFLLAAAPTGIGKTAAALAATIEVARNANSQQQILFLTGRQSQHRIVIETVRNINSRLEKEISKVKVVDLIGRESMCDDIDRMTSKCSCEDGVIEGTRQSRRDDMREYILKDPKHVDEIIQMSKTKKICAWAASRSAVKDCDILVCDYNHVFVENVRERSLPSMSIDLENTIIIVDEAHNLVSRIVNKLGKKKQSIPISLYTLLMKATNVKIVLLSVTPIINYPNEIGILFNILRGNITSWSLKLDIREQKQINTTYLRRTFYKSTPFGCKRFFQKFIGKIIHQQINYF
ncbi:MAG: DEAD/DEAH box helicase family protein [Candidatus Poseidoniales archaeon]|nr:DEAD/DEAH box helicase family protein [Candidatus Poseidoniales archaeon]